MVMNRKKNRGYTLIEIVEMLFEEWYVARHKRQEKLERVKLIGADKAAQKTQIQSGDSTT